MAKVTLERLQKMPLTKHLTGEQVRSLLPSVQELERASGEIIFQQGQPANFLYYVESGEVVEVGTDAQGRQTVPRHAGPGSYLGRYGLVTGRPFRIAATAIEPTTLLIIPLRDLQPILFSYPDWRDWFFQMEVAARLRAIPLFKSFRDWDIYRLADQIQVKNYMPRQTIFRAGKEADGFYVIDRGRVRETANGHQPRYLSSGNFFGEGDSDGQQTRQTTATAETPTRLFFITHEVLQALRDSRPDALSEILPRIDVVGQLSQIPLFAALEPQHLHHLAGYVNLLYFPPGHIVARQGEPASKLMILCEGEALVRRQVGQERPRTVGYLKADWGANVVTPLDRRNTGTFFGEHALLADEIRGATIEVTIASTWLVLDRKDFARFLQDVGLQVASLNTQPAATEGEESPPHPHTGNLRLPYETRRHWIVPVTQLTPLALTILTVLGIMIADLLSTELAESLRSLILMIGGFFLIILAPWTVWRYVNWRNDLFMVTNEGVVHLERVPFPFPRENRYEAPLRQIQNVNIFVSAIGRVLGYGDLSVDTAAIRGQVQFTRIPNPAQVQNLIRNATGLVQGTQIQIRDSVHLQLEQHLFPDRIRPQTLDSVYSAEEPAGPPPMNTNRRGCLMVWLPQQEIHEGDRITWRKHWFNLLSRAGLPFSAFAFMVYLVVNHILVYLVESFGLALWLSWPPVSWVGFQNWTFLLTLVLSASTLVWFIYYYVDWRNDVYIVNNNEVIDVERRPLVFPLWFFFSENRKQASLERVQNVNLRIPNLMAVIFNFGDVVVQTAGMEGNLDFMFVSNPRHVQAEIIRRLAAFRERQEQRANEEHSREMAEWISAYHRLNPHGEAGSDPGVSDTYTP